MPSAKDVYINVDQLENLPVQNKDNYLSEINLLQQKLRQASQVLQIGSMDGMRIIRLLEARPDLKLVGLEIEAELVKIAKQNIAAAGVNARLIVGDITDPPALPQFDYVICLNNTLGYISNQERALKQMRKLGKIIIISVYGEKFDDNLAQTYFKILNLEIERIEANLFMMKDFITIKRYTKEEVVSWGGEVIETPIGYYCILDASCANNIYDA